MVSKDKVKLGSNVKLLKVNINVLCGNEVLIYNEYRRNFDFKEESLKIVVLKEYVK